MPQDRLSGTEGNRYGREMGKKIAKALGAKPLEDGSNKCVLNGELLVVKSARFKTNSIGVSYKMLDNIKGILAAFEQEDGSYEIFRIRPEFFKKYMYPTRSKGASAGKVGLVRRSLIEKYGNKVKKIAFKS